MRDTDHDMTGSHRLFVAVDPPPALAAELAGWARAQRVRGEVLRVMSAERVHLTLAFLGERPVTDVDVVAAALTGAVGDWGQAGAGGPVTLELGAPVWLPPRHPRALAVQVGDPSGRLGELRDAVARALEAALGEEGERRRFRPHLTVARLSGRGGGRGALEPSPAGTFTVREAVLYRSFLEPAGARYEALERVPL